MAKRNITYELAQKYVKDKDTAVNTFIDNSLDKTQQIFTYEGLPETIPQSELENLLQTKGHCIIVKQGGDLYAVSGGFSGENDAYNRPRFYTVSNIALKLYKTFEIGKDCVLVKNDFHALGMLPILQKYAVLMTDSEISLNTAAILSRITMLISATDDKTKSSADLFVQKILNGDFSVIGENGFFDGVRMQTAGTTNSAYIVQLIELVQYYKASFLNEIGLNANYNMKRERLNESEVLMNIDNLLPLIENMFTERMNAVIAINKMFGTDIVVDYNGVWKTTHEHADKESEVAETVTDEEVEAQIEETGEAVQPEPETSVDEGETPDANDETNESDGFNSSLNDTDDTTDTADTDDTEDTDDTTDTADTDDTEDTKEKR